MKRLLLLLLCMLAYTPAAFASTWQEDVEAVTSHPEKVYEVYCGMPYEDFEQTWENIDLVVVSEQIPTYENIIRS